MFENFTATDRWSKKQVHCTYQSQIVAISTRHADAVDYKFLVGGHKVWVVLPCVAWVEYRKRTGRTITDSLAVEIAEGVEIEGLAVTGAKFGINVSGAKGVKVRGNWFGVGLGASRAKWRFLPAAHTDDICYLQYSSGSTRFPHGVAVTHGSLMANLAAHAHGMQFGQRREGQESLGRTGRAASRLGFC